MNITSFFLILTGFIFVQCDNSVPVLQTTTSEFDTCGTAGYCWEIGPSQSHPFAGFDVNAGIAYHGDSLYMIGGNGSRWDRSTYQWQLWAGPDVDHMTQQPTPIFNEDFPNYITQNCDTTDAAWCQWQLYWPMGLYIDEAGVFYTIAYTEYNFRNGWQSEAKERRLGLAKSFNKGRSWSYFGDIITQNKQDPPPPNKTYNGAGDISFFIADDGYAYIYYKTGFYDNTTLVRDIQNVSVARSPLTEKFAPGSWTKFYNGIFQEPGINGREDYIFPETDLVCITYNTHIQRFVLFGGSSVAHDAYISFCDDMTLQNWTPKDFTIEEGIRLWYFWPLDPNSSNPYKTGQSFRLYTSGVQNSQRVGYYKTITLSP